MITFGSGQGFSSVVISRQGATGTGLRSGGQIDSHFGARCFQITNVHSSSSYDGNCRKERGPMTDDFADKDNEGP